MISVTLYCPGCGQLRIDTYRIEDGEADYAGSIYGDNHQSPACVCPLPGDVKATINDWSQELADAQRPPLPASHQPPDHRTY